MKVLGLIMAVLCLASCTKEGSEGITTLRISWWGGQLRHEITQRVLDRYTELNPSIRFEPMPSNWNGYFNKLAIQAASASMPDIIQMDYQYLKTYAKNKSLLDLSPLIADGTINTDSIDPALMEPMTIDGERTGVPIAMSIIAFAANPTVLAEAGMDIPPADWSWEDFIRISGEVRAKTGKWGFGKIVDGGIELFNYWMRERGASLYKSDGSGLGYDDDAIMISWLDMWKELSDRGAMPNPDEWATMQTAGKEGEPIVTDRAAFSADWENFTVNTGSLNQTLKLLPPPQLPNGSKGLWLKPGQILCIGRNSAHQKEAAKFINWFIHSKEAADILRADRGTPVSPDIISYLNESGSLSPQETDMFAYVEYAKTRAGEAPPPDPQGQGELVKAHKEAMHSVLYGRATSAGAAAEFRKKAEDIFRRNQQD